MGVAAPGLLRTAIDKEARIAMINARKIAYAKEIYIMTFAILASCAVNSSSIALAEVLELPNGIFFPHPPMERLNLIAKQRADLKFSLVKARVVSHYKIMDRAGYAVILAISDTLFGVDIQPGEYNIEIYGVMHNGFVKINTGKEFFCVLSKIENGNFVVATFSMHPAGDF